MSEEELLQRAAEERASIVSRYKKGRENGAQIDPWEDPAFEIYHVTDRHGFIHDKRLPAKAGPNEARQIQIEMERVKKWLKMINSWETAVTTEKMRRRLFKGIPNSLRGQVWALLLNVKAIKEENKGKYQDMLELAYRWSPDIRQIDLDVNRTYRDHIMFRERYGLQQQALFNVLSAYSVYNLDIGYCQGMSQIAALLLMYLSEEDAFWALSILIADKKYAMHGFFIPGFPKLLRYQEHHDKIMNKFLPKLKKHLDKNGVDTGIYTLKWFFQCFLDRVPFTLTLRIWDVYLFIGERVITAMALNLLRMHRRTLNNLGMDEILQFLQVKLEHDFGFEDDVVMVNLEQSMAELKRHKLDYAGSPPPHELPKRPFGQFSEPTFERKVGRRSHEFSAIEKATKESVVLRRDAAVAEHNSTNSNSNNRNSRVSVGDGLSDKSYGVHFTEYSGIGDLKIMGLSQRNEPTVPRTHLHFGDGSMASSRFSKIPLDVLAREVDRNKAWWVEKPGENSEYLHSLHDKYIAKPAVDLYFSTKSKFTFFPRSRKFDMEYIKNAEKTVNEDAKPQISEECDASKISEQDSGDMDLEAEGIQPETSEKKADILVPSDREDICTCIATEEVAGEGVSADVGKEDVNIPSETEQDRVTEKQSCTCEKKEEHIEEKAEPPCPEPPAETSVEYRNMLRREEMFRVGRPFMSGRCTWFNELYKTEKLPRVGHTDKRQYEYKHFSNL
ncbi:USP6 N-terminal-like protein isoform X2 [Schistocerca gregaria]|uniref:USP6 N-terminal-like protein isoform X2 n=1 Tax=Schistocerca gregaria TaxID=7010 RepID=UPI00211DC575|nr:USP6 N-terminal-like protein isoform X2 [Schistocerca gregaria]